MKLSFFSRFRGYINYKYIILKQRSTYVYNECNNEVTHLKKIKIMNYTKQQTTTESLLQEVVDTIENESISNLKSDFTGWNLVEAIENLSFELKRLNDREEQK